MTYEEILGKRAQEDERLMVLTSENRVAIRNLPSLLGERFVDFGIAEQTMVGAAAGLALRGRIPVVHALATFLTMRAFEFIRTDVGVAGLPVKLVGGVPGFLSEANGPTHQAIEDVALMRLIPGMMIFCPSDREELARGLPVILDTPAPCYIRHVTLPPVVIHQEEFAAGRAETLSDGEDITILVYGILLREAVKAKAVLEERGRSVRLINLRTVAPIDEDAILRAAAETSVLVTLEDHFRVGGLFTVVAELLVKYHMRAQVIPIALNSRWFKPLLLDHVLEYEGFTGTQIADRILEEL
ncbi:MAG TPA: transketolase C-terminal domain-containing protein [Bacteroidota bacterium]|nr:transketolase C-terminal domain-containing protein [Bacteroidota bacterium]